MSDSESRTFEQAVAHEPSQWLRRAVAELIRVTDRSTLPAGHLATRLIGGHEGHPVDLVEDLTCLACHVCDRCRICPEPDAEGVTAWWLGSVEIAAIDTTGLYRLCRPCADREWVARSLGAA